jgi:hypothetical protein
MAATLSIRSGFRHNPDISCQESVLGALQDRVNPEFARSVKVVLRTVYG